MNIVDILHDVSINATFVTKTSESFDIYLDLILMSDFLDPASVLKNIEWKLRATRPIVHPLEYINEFQPNLNSIPAYKKNTNVALYQSEKDRQIYKR